MEENNGVTLEQITSYLSPSDVEIIIYHKSCPDGEAAAFAAHRLNPDIGFIEYTPGKEMIDISSVKGKNVCIADVSFSLEQHREVVETANKVIVLDHHKSAMLELGKEPNCLFDMKRSGCRLAWEYFHPLEPVPKFIQYIEDRDLWAWKLKPESECFTIVFSDLVGHNSLFFGQFMDETKVKEYVDKGKLYIKNRDRTVERESRRSYMKSINGKRVRVVNSSSHISELGNALCKNYSDCDYSFVWFQQSDENYKISLRSVGDMDVSEVAKQMGGGGHKNSAGIVWKKDLKEIFDKPADS